MTSRRILRRSVHTDMALAGVRPRLRGVSHQVAAAVSLPIAGLAIVLSPAGRPRVAVAAFTLGITAMFALSGVLHLRRWAAHVHERLLRLDHTGIYLAIAGTGIALGLLGFEGWPRAVVLVGVALGVVAGIVLEWLPFAAPRGFNTAVYLTIGWVPVVLLPWLWFASGPAIVTLLVAGGALYTVGAIVVGLRRPRLSPTWFGYHELFHVFVIGAVVLHAVMIAVLVQRAG
jgi:hemolysin III